ncbi:MAG: putative paraquat-inducible protein A [Akkermansiaceae bacterium]|jgi:uncharacterized paraquat-inducible protein A
MTVSLPKLLLVIVLLPFLWIMVDWMFARLGARRMTRRQRRVVRECHLCGKHYPEGHRVKLSTCPDCSAQNVRGGHRKLG